MPRWRAVAAALVGRWGHRRALYVLESMGELRKLDVEDYCRIVHAFIMQQVEAQRLARFEEVALDMLSFADDAMHNYFAHLSSRVAESTTS